MFTRWTSIGFLLSAEDLHVPSHLIRISQTGILPERATDLPRVSGD
jgi:hypothetical protein